MLCYCRPATAHAHTCWRCWTGHCPMTGVAVLWSTFSHGTPHTEHSPHTRWSVQTDPGSGMVPHCLAGVSPSEGGCSHWKLCIVVIIQSLWNERYKGRYEVGGPQSENYLEKIFPRKRGGGAESDQVMNVIVACSMLSVITSTSYVYPLTVVPSPSFPPSLLPPFPPDRRICGL